MAVYEAASEAVSMAREGKGPSLIECKTYRVKGHFEGDPMAYRDEEEAAEWMAKDPIKQFEKKLLEMGLLTQEKIKKLDGEIEKELDEAIRFAEESPFPDPSELTQDIYTS
jgi:pyruvate dehydrogenase E1 component alpha subunit